MGYYTRYSLQVSQLTDELDKFLENHEHDYGENFYSDLMTGNVDTIKWYDHDKDMIALSLKFPDIVFTLKGEGEESGDIWLKYYKNGKMQEARAMITFEKFDPSKLR